jgi:hypothetical protein
MTRIGNSTSNIINKHHEAYIFSSDDANNPINKSEDGSVFSVQLDHAISIPPQAYDAFLQVINARAWNTVNNISALLQNNKFYLNYNSVAYTMTIPDGLYSVSSLNTEISKILVNLNLNSDIVSITGNSASQTIVLTFHYVGTWVDFNQPNSMRVLLGFEPGLAPPSPSTTVGQTVNGTITAAFNNVENFLIKSDIINDSIPSNNVSDQNIAYLPITSSPGSQVYNEYLNPIKLNASSLKGSGRNYITFRLTDQAGVPANTGESWGLTLVISYKIVL